VPDEQVVVCIGAASATHGDGHRVRNDAIAAPPSIGESDPPKANDPLVRDAASTYLRSIGPSGKNVRRDPDRSRIGRDRQLEESSMPSRLTSLLSRSARIRTRIDVEQHRAAPRTTELIRLKGLLLRLQRELHRVFAGGGQLQPVPVRARRPQRAASEPFPGGRW
jgi:hypothetical protein